MFKAGKDQRIFPPDSIEIEGGIQFDQCPTGQHDTFWSLTQVRSGATAAVCCLAVTSDASICALKIFRKTGEATEQAATHELSNWNKIYGHKNWYFMRVADIAGTQILVLPFFDAPGNAKEREFLLSGAEEDSLLWKALDAFASKGYTHNDLKCHHVGILPSSTKKFKRVLKTRLEQQKPFCWTSEISPRTKACWMILNYGVPGCRSHSRR